MIDVTEAEDRVTKVYCECGSTEYEVKDNRSKEVMLLVCTTCGSRQEWKLSGYEED